MPLRFGSLVLLAAMGCGGHSHPAQDVPPDFSFAACPAPKPELFVEDICKPNECGHNSPVANTFPINGFTTTPGGCNPEQVQIVPKSLRGGACGSGGDLGTDHGELVGKRNGKPVCRGQQLTGATFIVRSTLPSDPKVAQKNTSSLTLTIANVRSFEVEDQNQTLQWHTGYRIEAAGRSLCDASAAQDVRRELHLRSRELGAETTATYVPDPAEDLVVPVTGELYGPNDELLDKAGEDFFTLACVGDAIAKTTFYDLRIAGGGRKNQSGLRMVTANYCGKHQYTMRGVMIDWTREQRTLEVEAAWSDGKAACITTGRLTRLRPDNDPDVTHHVDPRTLPDSLQPDGCKRKPTESLGQCDEAAWNAAVRAECRLDPKATCPVGLGDPKIEGGSTQFDFVSLIHEETKGDHQQVDVEVRRPGKK